MTTTMTTPFGVRIRARRQELGLSQEQAAVALGTTAVTLGRWEKGTDYPRKMTWIPKLALWLGEDRGDVARLIAASLPDDGPDDSPAGSRPSTAAGYAPDALGRYLIDDAA